MGQRTVTMHGIATRYDLRDDSDAKTNTTQTRSRATATS